MDHLLRVVISSLLLFILSPLHPINAQNNQLEKITSELELLLNKKDDQSFINLIKKENLPELNISYKNFINRFPNARWTISALQKNNSDKIQLEIQIDATRELNSQLFSLNTTQLLEIRIKNGEIFSSKVLNEISILKSINTPLKVKIDIPNKVLTGSRYDADIVIKNPLGDNFLSGGIMISDNNKLKKIPSPNIELLPLSAGGLFKSIQAPFKPGNQTLAALLIHPEGLIAITKVITIVSSAQDLTI